MAHRKDGPMTIRIIGALLIVVGCSCFGFLASSAHKKEVAALKIFLESLDIMESELRYRKTPLPALCRYTATVQSGPVGVCFLYLAQELEQLSQADAATCVISALKKTNQLPQNLRDMFYMLGRSLGKFDVDGQLIGIQSVRSETQLRLSRLCTGQEQRLKSYRTLGVCAGAALAILLF